MFCSHCGAPLHDGEKFCSSCGAPVEEITAQQPADASQPAAPVALSMNWFKFLVYFLLFASAIVSFASCISYFTGSQYTTAEGVTADLVYEVFPLLKPLDIFMGVFLILYAAFVVIVRFRLAGYKKNAPRLLLVMYSVNAASGIIYAVGALIATEGQIAQSVWPMVVGTVIGSFIMIYANYVYFKKRAALFVK